MLKRLVLGSGMALVAVGIAIVPVLAYVGTPGSTCATSTTTVVAGGSLTFTAHFVGGAGQTVTFSASGGTGTVTFAPPTAVTNATGDVSTTATFSAGSSGAVNLRGDVGAQYCFAGAAVTAYPAASYLPLGAPVSFVWVAVLLIGLGLVGAAVIGRRQPGASKKDLDEAA